MKCAVRSSARRPTLLLETLGREDQRRTAPHVQRNVRCFRVSSSRWIDSRYRLVTLKPRVAPEARGFFLPLPQTRHFDVRHLEGGRAKPPRIDISGPICPFFGVIWASIAGR
jgi:hypothetical protein